MNDQASKRWTLANIGSQHEKNNLSSLSLQHRSSWLHECDERSPIEDNEDDGGRLHECDETSPIDELDMTHPPSTTPNVTMEWTNHASRAYDTELDTQLKETTKLSF
jgi:hypothetical protein